MDKKRQLKMIFSPEAICAASLPQGYTAVSFQKAHTADWLSICRCGLFPADADLAFAEKELASFPFLREGDILFAEDASGEKIATACGMLLPSSEGYLHWICAKPQARGSGVASALILHMASVLLTRGASCVFLTTDDHRLAAIKTYLRIGLRPVIDNQEMEERWKRIFKELGM